MQRRPDAVLIAQSPLQVLCALEASSTDGVTGLVLVPWTKRESRDGCASLLSQLGAPTAKLLSFRGIARLTSFLRLFVLGLSLRGRVKRVYFGTYTTPVALFVNLVRAKSHVLVDDGQKTINILRAPHLVGLDRTRPWPFSRAFVHSAELFTFYAKLAQECGRTARQNRLTHVSERLRSILPPDVMAPKGILFIGTHIADTYGPFERDLARVVAEAGERQMTYILHRRDDEARMLELGHRLGFEVVRFELPLELVFNHIWSPHRPEVWTFGSTATDTLRAMHEGLRVRVYRLDTDSFTRAKTGAAFASIYAHQEREPRVEVVPVPPATCA